MWLDLIYWIGCIYIAIGIAFVIFVVASLMVGSLKVHVLFPKKRNIVVHILLIVLALILLVFLWPLTFKEVQE